MPFPGRWELAFPAGKLSHGEVPWEVEGSMWPLALFACPLLEGKGWPGLLLKGQKALFPSAASHMKVSSWCSPSLEEDSQWGGRQYFQKLPRGNTVTARGDREKNPLLFIIDLLPLPTLWITQLSHFIQLVRRSPREFSSKSQLCPPDTSGQTTFCWKWGRGTALSWES